MQTVSLVSIVESSGELGEKALKLYKSHIGYGLDEDEIADLGALVKSIQYNHGNPRLLSGYFVGFSISQISREFDLLRFGSDTVVNIELKRESTVEKITYQLVRNRYYLMAVRPNVHCFTYVSSSNKLYRLAGEAIVEVAFTKLRSLVLSLDWCEVADIDALFKPSKFLISPFNDTDRFVDGRYFLTAQQEEHKRSILKCIESTDKLFMSLSGKAGSGKTLLAYDIVRDASRAGTKVLVIHTGNINEGQVALNEIYGWTIIPIKEVMGHDLTPYQLIVLDEAQRTRSLQFTHIIDSCKSNSIHCLFSFDENQWLQFREQRSDNKSKIAALAKGSSFRLTSKIRTNVELSTFIKGVFDMGGTPYHQKSHNVSLTYFSTHAEAQLYLELSPLKGGKL